MKRIAILLSLSMILLAGCTLAEDVTPPPGYQATQAALPTNIPASNVNTVPAGPPDPVNGQLVYAQKCAPCHGDQGLGDGPQAAQLEFPPAALADPGVSREAVPADWYQIVTAGRMDRMMPPFTSLTDAQRWDVVAYALSLATSDTQLAHGKAVYQASCASCHGATGSSSAGGVDFADPSWMVQQSSTALFSVISQGSGSAMPAFDSKLSEEDRWDVAAYVRSLAFAAPGAQQQAAATPGTTTTAQVAQTTTTPEAAQTATITGELKMGSPGGTLPPDLQITLHGFDGQSETVTETATADAEGKFEFANLDVVSGRLFILSTDYEGVRYVSEVSHLDAAGGTTDLPITIYDTTTDGSTVQASRLHLIVDFPTSDTMEVIELWVLSNTGDRTVAPSSSGGLQFSLPIGASQLSFETTQLAGMASSTPDGFDLALPVQPGQETTQLAFSFQIPYSGEVDFQQLVHYPVAGVTLLLPSDGPGVQGSGVSDEGIQDIGGQQYHQYGLASLKAGDSLRMVFSGNSAPLLSLNSSLLPLVLGGAALVLVLAGVIWWYKPGMPARAEAPRGGEVYEADVDSEEALLAAIAKLDDAFEAGEIDETIYRVRRNRLKQQALDALREGDD